MQSNVQQGRIVRLAGADLSDKEDYLVELYDASNTPKFQLPDDQAAYALYLLISGDSSGENVDAEPPTPGKNYRVKFKGTGNIGDMVCLADISVADDKGKLRALPSTAGTYRVFGWLEEDAVDGQLALVRWVPLGNVTVSD